MTPDQPVSLAVTVAGCAAALLLPRKWALLPLAASIVWHPSVLIVPPPQLSLTAQRVIALVLILRCVLSPEIRGLFKWRLVDTAVMFYAAMVTVTQILTAAQPGPAVNNRAGFFLSALLPYFCARFLLTDRDALFKFLKGMLWAAAPLALLGLYEMNSPTAFNPWDKIRDYGVIKAPRMSDGWRIFLGSLRDRARGPFVQYIMFGWFFALLMPLATSLFWEKKKLSPWIVAWLVMPFGVVSAIASGPMTLAGAALGLCFLFPFRRYAKAGAVTVAVVYVALISYSNRGPMQIISNFGFDSNSSWYRFKLTRFVLEQGGMKGHWFMGYGEIPPNFAEFHDLCIHWVWLLVLHGVMGVVGFYVMIGAVGREIWQARLKAVTTADQWILWSFMATLVGSLLAMLVVALFSETYYFYHLLLGLMANAGLYVGGGEALRHVGVLAQVNGQQVLLRYALKPGQRLALVHQHHDRPVVQPLDEKRGTVKVGTEPPEGP